MNGSKGLNKAMPFFHWMHSASILMSTLRRSTSSVFSILLAMPLPPSDGGILSGRCVYVAPGVSGNKGPSRDEVAALVKASGAVYYSQISGVTQMIKNRGDCTKLVVISMSGRTLPTSAIYAIEKGALELEWGDFVTAILHQEFRFNAEGSHQKSIINDDDVIVGRLAKKFASI
mmetsp:Transcript_22731/g.34443  ORF Transcript_22731/g.34443 Transcript_22731/m.34443 type:complete len:174 (+) Transcript_22731:244-765(+)